MFYMEIKDWLCCGIGLSVVFHAGRVSVLESFMVEQVERTSPGQNLFLLFLGVTELHFCPWSRWNCLFLYKVGDALLAFIALLL